MPVLPRVIVSKDRRGKRVFTAAQGGRRKLRDSEPLLIDLDETRLHP
ncbi:MAG: hypothetical protein LJE70_18545 [Chromatiaceae bacterium]|nr:hypothetical protein [Chromatiaceae bacterium]